MNARVVAAVALLLAPCAASAGPIGPSWDGDPPGTLLQLEGLSLDQLTFGHPLFDAGSYAVTFEAGTTAWRDRTTIAIGGELALAPGAFVTETYRFTSATPWSLFAVTPSVRSSSTDVQWAFYERDGLLRFGFEDIAVGQGDQDYQDLLGWITRTDVTVDKRTLAVPEPSEIVLAVGLFLGWFSLSYGKRSRR